MARDVKINVTAQNGASRTFLAIGNDADRMGQKVEQSGRLSADSLKRFNDLAFAAGAALGTLTLAANKAYGEAQASNARLAQSFENVGLSVDDFSNQLDNLGKTANHLAFDDEDLQDSLSQLISVTKDADQAFRDLSIAQDIARARNISIEAATRIVIAAETGRTESLKRLGIVVDETGGKEAALASLQQQYAGQAEAYADTTAASWERLGNTIENQLESIGGALDSLTVPLLALSAAGPVITSVGGAVGGLIGGAGGLAALATTLGTVGAASAALAAPLGITYYLWKDQANVVKDATEQTLANQAALEGYIRYLNTLNLPTEQFAEMSQEMKSLLDWVTKTTAAGFETIIDPDLNRQGDEFVATLGSMSDELQSLDPENLKSVLDLMNQLGISVSDPSTWDAENISLVTQLIYLLAKAENEAGYEAYELNRGVSGANAVLSDTAAQATLATAALKELGGVGLETGKGLNKVGGLGADIPKRTTDFNELTVAIGDSAGEIGTFVQRAGEGSQAMRKLADDVAALNASLGSLGAADVLDSTFGAIVGYTNDIVGSIDQVKEWSDALLAPLGTDFQDNGTMSTMLDLLQRGKIDAEDYNEALDAQTHIYGDLARAQDASAIIQIKQANYLADASDATADYLENLSQLPEHEQALALAYADQDLAGRAQDIADMAVNYDDMSVAQQKAFANTVTSAAAVDPLLAGILEDMGLIKQSATDPTGWTISTDTSDAESDMERVSGLLNDIVTVMEQAYLLQAKATLSTEEFWQVYYSLPSSKDLTLYIHQVNTPGDDYGGHATGGMASFARGGMAHLAELGPEMLTYPNGATGLAMTEGVYSIPNGTLVHTAASTRDQLRDGMSFAGATFNFYGVQNPEQFGRQMTNYSSVMERR